MSISMFRKWTDAVLYLNKKIKDSSLIAGRNIQLENTGNGIKIHSLNDNPQPADTYRGMFKVIQTAADKIKIVDGLDIESENCGEICVNKLEPVVVPATELTITEDTFIYLNCQGLFTGMAVLSGVTPSIIQLTEMPSWVTWGERVLISRVKFTPSEDSETPGCITSFSQENVLTRINILGGC